MAVVGGRVDRLTGRPKLPVFGVYDWSPFYLGSALLGYWDAEQAQTLTLAGSAVTAWADRVGGYPPSQATAGNRPTYSATSFNGRPGVTFDAVDDYLELTGVPAGIPTGTTPCEMWALVNNAAAGATAGNMFALSYGIDLGGRQLGRTSTTSVNRGRVVTGNGASSVMASDTVTDLSGIHLLRATISATSESIYVDGGAPTTSAVVPATASTVLRIGASANTPAASFWNGVINALFITQPLTADQAAQMTVFLKARGGIA